MKFQEMYEESAYNSFIYQLDSPCAFRADPILDSVLRSLNAGKTSGVFEGLQFYYPHDADDYYDMKKKIEDNGGFVNVCSEFYYIPLVPRGWVVYDENQWISYEYIDHCIRVAEIDCFCGFEV